MNLFRLKKEKDDATVRGKRNLSKLQNENGAIKNIRNLFKYKEQDYYKPVRVGNSRSNNYIDYERNCETMIEIKHY